jgi:tyrosinase
MANGVILRQSVEGLQGDPVALAALRDAYRKMQALSGSDNRSWIYWAGLHGFPQWLCWHHGRAGMGSPRPYNLFLPWHRAYLLYFEAAMRDQNSAAVLPWWNWTSDVSHQIGVPTSFAQPQVAGARNPLFSGPVPPIQSNPARFTVRFPGNPAALPTAAAVDALLSLSSFLDFTNQIEDIHDRMHGWTGGFNPSPPPDSGDMGTVVSSAFDPIFWSHHCMIDRLWYLWQLRNGLGNIPPDYLNRALSPFNLTVQDVLDIRALGYEYAVQTVVPVP